MKRIEIIILGLLWFGGLTTYPIALLNGYSLFTSNWIGLAGLSIVTVVAIVRPDKLLTALLVLLFFGTLNLASFIYFINIVLTFGFSGLLAPGIQCVSLLLLVILFTKRSSQIMEQYRGTALEIEQNELRAKLNAKNQYKKRFKRLTDKEIESKLQRDLVPEAIQALNEIVEERKKTLQQST